MKINTLGPPEANGVGLSDIHRLQNKKVNVSVLVQRQKERRIPTPSTQALETHSPSVFLFNSGLQLNGRVPSPHYSEPSAIFSLPIQMQKHINTQMMLDQMSGHSRLVTLHRKFSITSGHHNFELEIECPIVCNSRSSTKKNTSVFHYRM